MRFELDDFTKIPIVVFIGFTLVCINSDTFSSKSSCNIILCRKGVTASDCYLSSASDESSTENGSFFGNMKGLDHEIRKRVNGKIKKKRGKLRICSEEM